MRLPLPFIVALSIGGIAGSAFWGWISQGRLGRRGAITAAAAIGMLVSPLYVMSADARVLFAGALGFKERPYFTATAGAEKPPKVDFNFSK